MHRGTTRPAGSHNGKRGGRDRAPLSSWPLSLTLAMAAALAVLAALLVHEGRAPALGAQVPGGAPAVGVGHRPGPGLRHDGAQHCTLRRDVGHHQRRIGHLSMRPAGARPRQRHATLQIGTASPEARHTTDRHGFARSTPHYRTAVWHVASGYESHNAHNTLVAMEVDDAAL
jgi:hypothetical protein